MGENSLIQWTDHTFSAWIGCQKVSPGCDHCYADDEILIGQETAKPPALPGEAASKFPIRAPGAGGRTRLPNGGIRISFAAKVKTMMDKRYGRVEWGPHGERKRTSEAYWKQPLRWARQANGTRPRVFCASLSDVFDNQAPTGARCDLFNLIRKTPELDWLLLTKRPENIAGMLPKNNWPWPNVWLGTTAEDQAHYNRRWPILSRIPAALAFISYEPALGPLTDLYATAGQAPDWIICGGESGAGARMMNPQWARDLRDQCAERSIPYFFKQMTGKKPIPEDLQIRQFPRVSR